MNTEVMFSSKTDNWSTPDSFYKLALEKYNINPILDVCADSQNTRCKLFYTKKEDGLKQEWDKDFWMNPPYGRNIQHWIKKAYNSCVKYNVEGVMLLPARTDTKWFHDYIYNKSEIHFIKGRLKFGDSKNSAPFPSILVIYRKRTKLQLWLQKILKQLRIF